MFTTQVPRISLFINDVPLAIPAVHAYAKGALVSRAEGETNRTNRKMIHIATLHLQIGLTYFGRLISTPSKSWRRQFTGSCNNAYIFPSVISAASTNVHFGFSSLVKLWFCILAPPGVCAGVRPSRGGAVRYVRDRVKLFSTKMHKQNAHNYTLPPTSLRPKRSQTASAVTRYALTVLLILPDFGHHRRNY